MDIIMDEENKETLNLSKRGLKKIEKATDEESKTVINLKLDQNELHRLDNIDSYNRVENLSICNNFLTRMHLVSKLSNLRMLSLNNNGILQIEGLKELIFLKVLKLAGNSIKSIEHLNHNLHLEHLDLSQNQISFVTDLSYLKCLKHLNLERNRIKDLQQCDRYLPGDLEHLQLAHNNIQDLTEVSHLVHLKKLANFTIQGNPCVAMAAKDKLGFDYRPFVLNWILTAKSIDGFVVSAMESLKAEWLYSQGRGRHFSPGQHADLVTYLAAACPVTGHALETEDQRKLRLILTKAQQHQQQLKESTGTPTKPRLQSPRLQSRMNIRAAGRSPDRMVTSYHAAVTSLAHVTSHAAAMTQSLDSATLFCRDDSLTTGLADSPSKPINQPLEAASKMVPVPESLMSPDYQDPMYDIQKTLPKPQNHSNTSVASDTSEKRHIVPPSSINKSHRTSPKLTKSATSSPKFKSKLEQRKGSFTDTRINGRVNGVREKDVESEKEVIQKKKKWNVETMAAVTIQKMWRGYRSRNLNRDSLRIVTAIQAERARQHIQKLSCDMAATKAALDSERQIQQLQMQAINALWRKVSALQASDTHKQKPESEDNSEVLKQLTETCCMLQTQVGELQSCMQRVLHAVTSQTDGRVTSHTQTDVTCVTSPQDSGAAWLRRPQSLSLTSVRPTVVTVETSTVPDCNETTTDDHQQQPQQQQPQQQQQQQPQQQHADVDTPLEEKEIEGETVIVD